MTQAFTTGTDDLDQIDHKAHSDVEGRTAQRRVYRRLSSSGYRNTLSELLCGVYNPLKEQVECST